MHQIALHHLHDRTTEILREVREEKTEYVVTQEGRPIARLSPMTAEPLPVAPAASEQEGWTHYAEIAETVREAWPDGQRTQDVLDEVRRR